MFDIVIPTLDLNEARLTVESLKHHATYAHHFIIIDNSEWPTGYVKACNRGARAGDMDYVFFVNDDVTMRTYGWDEDFVDETESHTYCMYPEVTSEKHMRLNGWFFGLRRDYIEAYGWAFDPRYHTFCADVDLIKRLEDDHIEPVAIPMLEIDHLYSKTVNDDKYYDWCNANLIRDLMRYKEKWGTDANKDKVR